MRSTSRVGTVVLAATAGVCFFLPWLVTELDMTSTWALNPADRSMNWREVTVLEQSGWERAVGILPPHRVVRVEGDRSPRAEADGDRSAKPSIPLIVSAALLAAATGCVFIPRRRLARLPFVLAVGSVGALGVGCLFPTFPRFLVREVHREREVILRDVAWADFISRHRLGVGFWGYAAASLLALPATLLYGLARPRPAVAAADAGGATKPCPHCGRELPRYAGACGFCKRVLVEPPSGAPQSEPTKSPDPPPGPSPGG